MELLIYSDNTSKIVVNNEIWDKSSMMSSQSSFSNNYVRTNVRPSSTTLYNRNWQINWIVSWISWNIGNSFQYNKWKTSGSFGGYNYSDWNYGYSTYQYSTSNPIYWDFKSENITWQSNKFWQGYYNYSNYEGASSVYGWSESGSPSQFIDTTWIETTKMDGSYYNSFYLKNGKLYRKIFNETLSSNGLLIQNQIKKYSPWYNHQLVLYDNGDVYCSGDNTYWQCLGGNNSLIMTGVTDITAGYNTSYFVKNGMVYSVWYNNYWQLGNGTLSNSTTLVTVSWITTASKVFANTYWMTAYIILSDGSVKGMGMSNYYQLWVNVLQQTTPITITWLTNVSKITSTMLNAYFLTNSWTVYFLWYAQNSAYLNWVNANQATSVYLISGLSGVTDVVTSLYSWYQSTYFLLSDWRVFSTWRDWYWSLARYWNNSVLNSSAGLGETYHSYQWYRFEKILSTDYNASYPNGIFIQKNTWQYISYWYVWGQLYGQYYWYFSGLWTSTYWNIVFPDHTKYNDWQDISLWFIVESNGSLLNGWYWLTGYRHIYWSKINQWTSNSMVTWYYSIYDTMYANGSIKPTWWIQVLQNETITDFCIYNHTYTSSMNESTQIIVKTSSNKYYVIGTNQYWNHNKVQSVTQVVNWFTPITGSWTISCNSRWGWIQIGTTLYYIWQNNITSPSGYWYHKLSSYDSLPISMTKCEVWTHSSLCLGTNGYVYSKWYNTYYTIGSGSLASWGNKTTWSQIDDTYGWWITNITQIVSKQYSSYNTETQTFLLLKNDGSLYELWKKKDTTFAITPNLIWTGVTRIQNHYVWKWEDLYIYLNSSYSSYISTSTLIGQSLWDNPSLSLHKVNSITPILKIWGQNYYTWYAESKDFVNYNDPDKKIIFTTTNPNIPILSYWLNFNLTQDWFLKYNGTKFTNVWRDGCEYSSTKFVWQWHTPNEWCFTINELADPVPETNTWTTLTGSGFEIEFAIGSDLTDTERSNNLILLRELYQRKVENCKGTTSIFNPMNLFRKDDFIVPETCNQ